MSQDPLALMEQRMKSLNNPHRSRLQSYIEKNPIHDNRHQGDYSLVEREALSASMEYRLPATYIMGEKGNENPSESTSKWITKSILRSLLTDVERLRPGTKGLERDLVTLEARIEHEGVSFVATALVNLGKAFTKGLSDGRFLLPVGWKHPKGSKLPCLFKGIFEDVFDSTTGDLVKGRDSTGDVEILCQLLFFLEEVQTGWRDSVRETETQGDLFIHEV